MAAARRQLLHCASPLALLSGCDSGRGLAQSKTMGVFHEPLGFTNNLGMHGGTSAKQDEGLIAAPDSLPSSPMSFYAAILAWLVIGAVLVLGIVMATKGAFLLLILGLLAFIGAFAKWGCATH